MLSPIRLTLSLVAEKTEENKGNPVFYFILFFLLILFGCLYVCLKIKNKK